MPPSRLPRRLLYLVACVAPIWALIAYVTDGFAFNVGPLKIKATEPIRPLMIAAAATALYVWRYSSNDISAYWQRLLTLAARVAVAAMPAIVLLAAFIGIYYGSFTAGGSDSYGYVSQAALWLKGSLRIEQSWVKQFSWPGREWTFAPLGYRPLSPIVALTLVSYIFYSEFDVWMYLRFILPAYPALFVLMAAGIRFVCRQVPEPARAFVTLLICVVSLAASFSFATIGPAGNCEKQS